MHSLAAANIIAREARHFLLIGLVTLTLGVTAPQNLFFALFGAACIGACVALMLVRRRFLPPRS